MRAATVSILVMFLLIGLASAQDWPMFRGNLQRTGFIELRGDITEPLVLWDVQVDNGMFASPAVADLNGDGYMEIVIAMEKSEGSNQESIIAFDRKGNKLWSYTTKGNVHSSPTIADLDGDGDMDIVFGTNSGEVYALEGSDGSKLWVLDILVGAFRSSPAVYDIDGDNNMEVLIGHTRGFYSIDGESGIVEWQYETKGEVSSSPAIGNLDQDPAMEVVFGSEGGEVYALKGDGTLSWEKNVGSPIVFSSPVITPNGVVIGTEGGRIVTVSKDKLSTTYQTESSILGSPAVFLNGSNSFMVFGTAKEEDLHGVYKKYSENKIYAINLAGKKLWEMETDGWGILSSPAMADIDRDGKVEAVVGSREGKLYVIEGKSGELEWSYLDATGMQASPAIVDLDGDGDVEIIVAYRFSNNLRVFDSLDKPDLIIDSITFSNPFPYERDVVGINVTLMNQGKIPSENKTILRLYRRSPIMDQPIGDLYFDSIRPKKTGSEVFEWTAALPPGELGIYAVLDPTNVTDESDETNNEFYQKFMNDLAIVNYNVNLVKTGESTIVATVGNKGKLEYEVEVTILIDDRQIAKMNKVISGNGNADFKKTFTFGEEDSEIYVVVDPNDKIKELYEDNNNVSKRLVMEEEVPVFSNILKSEEDTNTFLLVVLLLIVVGVVAKKAHSRAKSKREEKQKKKKKDDEKKAEEEIEESAEDSLEEEVEEKGTDEGEEAEAPEEAGETKKGGKDEEEPEEGEEAEEGGMIKIGGNEPSKPSVAPELQKLYDQKKKIEKVVEIAKKKYYKRQLDESSYKEIVRNNVEKLIDVEAEIEKLEEQADR